MSKMKKTSRRFCEKMQFVTAWSQKLLSTREFCDDKKNF